MLLRCGHEGALEDGHGWSGSDSEDDDMMSRDESGGTSPSYDINRGDSSDGFDDVMDHYDRHAAIAYARAVGVDTRDDGGDDDDDGDGVPTVHLKEPPKGQVGVILLAVGSFSPPTCAHVRLLIAARDALRESAFVCGAYMSPVSDAYGKPYLAAAADRIAMCALALRDLPWARVASWEARQTSYSRTHVVAQHLKDIITHRFPRSRFRIVLVCGADVRTAMLHKPDQWPPHSVAQLNRVVSFAVKRRSDLTAEQHRKDEEQRKQPPVAQLAPKNDVFEILDVDIEPWVGNLSSTVVRYVFVFPLFFFCCRSSQKVSFCFLTFLFSTFLFVFGLVLLGSM